MKSVYSIDDALWVSSLASVLAVLVRWNDFIAYFNEIVFLAAGVMLIVATVSVLYGLSIIFLLNRMLISPYSDESWGVNTFFYLMLCVTSLALGVATFTASIAPLAAFGTAAGLSAGISLLVWASYSYAGQSWNVIPPPSTEL